MSVLFLVVIEQMEHSFAAVCLMFKYSVKMQWHVFWVLECCKYWIICSLSSWLAWCSFTSFLSVWLMGDWTFTMLNQSLVTFEMWTWLFGTIMKWFFEPFRKSQKLVSQGENFMQFFISEVCHFTWLQQTQCHKHTWKLIAHKLFLLLRDSHHNNSQ